MQSPLENSPDHITALGKITARWSTLDTILVVIPGRLIGNHAAAEAIYFSSNSTQFRISCLRAVTLQTNKLSVENRDRCSHLLENLDDLWLSRNTLLHNPAVVTKDAVFSLWLKKPLREPPEERRPLPVANLIHHADRVSAISDELFKIVFPEISEMSAQLRASPDIQPEPDQS